MDEVVHRIKKGMNSKQKLFTINRFRIKIKRLIAKLNRIDIEFHQVQPRFDLNSELTHPTKQQANIVGPPVTSAKGGQPGFQTLFHDLLRMKSEDFIGGALR